MNLSPTGDRSPTSSLAAIQTPALLLDHVSKSFPVGRSKAPVEAVVDVSMRLERGDIHGVLGANGSGKSTLIRLVAGLLTIDAGRVEVFGHDVVRDELQVKRLINRVSVDAAFFKKLQPYGEPDLRRSRLRPRRQGRPGEHLQHPRAPPRR